MFGLGAPGCCRGLRFDGIPSRQPVNVIVNVNVAFPFTCTATIMGPATATMTATITIKGLDGSGRYGTTWISSPSAVYTSGGSTRPWSGPNLRVPVTPSKLSLDSMRRTSARVRAPRSTAVRSRRTPSKA